MRLGEQQEGGANRFGTWVEQEEEEFEEDNGGEPDGTRQTPENSSSGERSCKRRRSLEAALCSGTLRTFSCERWRFNEIISERRDHISSLHLNSRA